MLYRLWWRFAMRLEPCADPTATGSVEGLFNPVHHVLIPFHAEHHLLLCLVFSNTNFVRTNFHSFDFLSIRFVVREYTCDDFPLTEMNKYLTSTSELARSHSCSAFPDRMLFPDAVLLESRVLRLLLLLLLCMPIALQRNLGCWPWCCEYLEYYSISVMRSHDQCSLLP